MLPMAFDATEKRTHDYVRHGTTNLFAALNVGTGEVFGECKPTRDGDDFLAFLEESGETSRWQGHPSGVRQPVHSHHPSRTGLVGEESAHPLSLHPGRLVLAQPDRNLVWHHHPPVHPSGHFQQCQSPDQADTDYIKHWNTSATPFAWTATTDEILAKVRLVEANIKKLVDN